LIDEENINENIEYLDLRYKNKYLSVKKNRIDKRMKKEIIAAIDLGTTKVCAVIAEREEGKQSFNILGFG